MKVKLFLHIKRSDFDETLGVNDRFALSQAEETMKKRINKQHMCKWSDDYGSF